MRVSVHPHDIREFSAVALDGDVSALKVSQSQPCLLLARREWGVKKCDVVMEEVRRRKKRCQGQLLYNSTTHNCSSHWNQDLKLQCDTCSLQCKCGREGKRKDWSEWQEAGNMGATWCPVEIFQLPRSHEAFFRSNFTIFLCLFWGKYKGTFIKCIRLEERELSRVKRFFFSKYQ